MQDNCVDIKIWGLVEQVGEIHCVIKISARGSSTNGYRRRVPTMLVHIGNFKIEILLRFIAKFTGGRWLNAYLTKNEVECMCYVYHI